MSLKTIIKQHIYAISIVVLLLIYLFVENTLFEKSILTSFFIQLLHYYLNIINYVAVYLANILAGNNFIANGLEVIFQGKHLLELGSIYLSKKWLVSLCAIIILTKTSYKRKLIFLGYTWLVNFIISSLRLTTTIILYSKSFELESAQNIGSGFFLYGYIALLFIWIYKNWNFYTELSKKYGLSELHTRIKAKELFFILVIGTVIGNLFFGWFDFSLWISFLFNSTSYILLLFGVPSKVDGNYLLGMYADLFMAKQCLGLRTILVFASFIILTGIKLKPRLYYIIAGTVFINLVNILRFVFLFMHIQKYGKYMLHIDVHDLFDYIVYTLIFLLWILWLEKYSDIWPAFRKQINPKAD